MDAARLKELTTAYREICLLHPLYRTVPAQPHQYTLNFVLKMCQLGFNIALVTTDYTFIPFARNILTNAFVQTQAQNRAINKPLIKVVFWLDSDHNFTPDDFLALLDSFDKEKAQVMSARYLIRQKDRRTICAFKKNPETGYNALPLEETGITEVDAVGLGFLLMRPDVLEQAWIKKTYSLFSVRSVGGVGEDMVFCETLKEYGIKILVNHDIKIGHDGGELRG